MEVSDNMDIDSLDCSLKIDELPKLPQVALAIIKKARSRARGGGLRVIVAKTWNEKITVTKSDIKTLAPNNGLNNIIMDSYLELIGVRSKFANKEESSWPSVYVFRGCFYKELLDNGYEAVSEVTSSVNIFDFNLLLFPIHLIDHWGLAAVDFRIPSIKYYDSLGVEYPECFKVLGDYLREERRNKKGEKYPSELQAERVLNIPKQVNEYDCGVFACKYAEYLSRDAMFTFSQKDMKYYRKRMIYEIISQKLMFP